MMDDVYEVEKIMEKRIEDDGQVNICHYIFICEWYSVISQTICIVQRYKFPSNQIRN